MSKTSMMTAALFTGLSASVLAMPALAQNTVTTRESPGQILYDNGVTISLNYTGEFAANPSGGIKQGTAYAGQMYVGADFDLSKILGLDGTTFHLAFTQRHGDNLANLYIGNNTSVQQIWGTQNFHLAIMTVEQKLFNNRLIIQAGRTTANVNFLNSPIYCYFQTNSACGNPTFIFKNSNFTYFPASTWGSDAKFLFTPKTYVHVGAYEVNPKDMSANNNGFSLSFRGTTGVVIPYEIGYATDFTNDTLPRHYQIGGWYDTSEYADPLNNADGTPAITSGLPYARHHGRSGLFFRFDQQITRPDPSSERGMTIFGVVMTNTSGRVQENQFYELGVLQMGTFPGRDLDNIGFVINDQEFSKDFIDNIAAARTSAGGSPNIPHREIMMELEYTAEFTPYIQVAPNFQYIINPDQSSEPYRTSNIKNAFVVGINFYIDVAKMLNFGAPS